MKNQYKQPLKSIFISKFRIFDLGEMMKKINIFEMKIDFRGCYIDFSFQNIIISKTRLDSSTFGKNRIFHNYLKMLIYLRFEFIWYQNMPIRWISPENTIFTNIKFIKECNYTCRKYVFLVTKTYIFTQQNNWVDMIRLQLIFLIFGQKIVIFLYLSDLI